MRILYGVQATGQGHISRARAMAHALKQHPDVDVTWLFSGRPRERLFDMEPFGDFQHYAGLTFVTEAGQLRYRKTIMANRYWQFIRDVWQLDVKAYDLVVTDYEPVTAWAGKLRRQSVLGIGHQYAFGKNTPVEGRSLAQHAVMSLFAPVARGVGLHWSDFGANVLPPILDLPPTPTVAANDHILVYLPFEDQSTVTKWLNGFSEHRFIQYASTLPNDEQANVGRRTANIAGFKSDLASARGVVCNCGFELISECLHWRKPVLTRPLAKQMEQLSNGAALEALGYATVMRQIDNELAERWLAAPPIAPILSFPNVSATLASWLADGAKTPVATLGEALWRESAAV